MTEDVVINVVSKGTDVATKDILALAEAADKASITTDKLTGKVSAAITTLDKASGSTKKVVIEDNKLISAKETVTKELVKNDTAVKTVTRSYDTFGASIGRLVAAAGIGLAIKNLTQEIFLQTGAVSAANITLRAYFDTQQQFLAVSAIFNNVVGATSASLGSLTAAYGQLRASTELARFSNETLATVLVNANNAIRAGGASASEAARGTNEFAKALADGVISGKEYSDILATYPELARVFREETGISSQTLQTLGISASSAAGALERASKRLQEKAEANQTLSDRMSVVIDATAKFIVAFDKATGASKAIADALTFLTKNIDLIIPLIATAAAAWLGYEIAVTAAKVATVLLNGAIGGGIVGTIVKLIGLLGTAAAAWITYKNATKEAGGGGGEGGVKNPPNIDGARAGGGPVKAGNRYLVGEEGPELFVPGASGSIIPNGAGGMPVNASSSGSGYNARRAQDLLTEAVRDGVKTDLDAILRAIEATNALLSGIVAQASSGSAGAAGAAGGNALIPGMSAINNFGGDPASDGSRSFGTPALASTDIPAAGPAVPAQNLNVDYWTGIYKKALDKQRREGIVTGNRDARLDDLKKVYDSIPNEIRNQVVGAASTAVYGTPQGGTVQFRTGGQARVAGSGGADSKFVGMRVTPGELVDVKTRRQADNESKRGGDTYISVTFDVKTPDADSFRKTEKQISRDFLTTLAKAAQ